MYLLDTNIVSYWMRGDEHVIERAKGHPPAELALAAITLAEVLYGIARSPGKKRERRRKIGQITSLVRLYPFDEQVAEAYAQVRLGLEKAGTPISERDTQIAATALAHGLTVVTHNEREFTRVPRLQVEDWARP